MADVHLQRFARAPVLVEEAEVGGEGAQERQQYAEFDRHVKGEQAPSVSAVPTWDASPRVGTTPSVLDRSLIAGYSRAPRRAERGPIDTIRAQMPIKPLLLRRHRRRHLPVGLRAGRASCLAYGRWSTASATTFPRRPPPPACAGRALRAWSGAAAGRRRPTRSSPHAVGLSGRCPTCPSTASRPRAHPLEARRRSTTTPADRPVAWVDDAFTPACHAWAQQRRAPTLLVPRCRPRGSPPRSRPPGGLASGGRLAACPSVSGRCDGRLLLSCCTRDCRRRPPLVLSKADRLVASRSASDSSRLRGRRSSSSLARRVWQPGGMVVDERDAGLLRRAGARVRRLVARARDASPTATARAGSPTSTPSWPPSRVCPRPPARRRLWHRVPHPPPAGSRGRDRPEPGHGRRRGDPPATRRGRPGRGRPAAVRRRRLRPGGHRPLLRPPARRPSARLPRRGRGAWRPSSS